MFITIEGFVGEEPKVTVSSEDNDTVTDVTDAYKKACEELAGMKEEEY